MDSPHSQMMQRVSGAGPKIATMGAALLVVAALLTIYAADNLVRGAITLGLACFAAALAFAWAGLRQRKRGRVRALLHGLGTVMAGTAGVLVILAAARIPTYWVLQAAYGDLKVLGECLRDYADEHGDFPGKLEDLVDTGRVHEGLLRSRYSSEGPYRGCDYAYVTGLKPGDPGDWPLLFEIEDLRRDGTRLVVRVSGVLDRMTRDEFERLLTRFQEEFEEARGSAPTILRDP